MKIIYLVIFGFSSFALAQVNYTVSVSCASQGAWSQKALGQAQQLESYISTLQVKGDACKAAAQTLQQLVTGVTNYVQNTPQGSIQNDNRDAPEAQPAQLEALQSLVNSPDPNIKQAAAQTYSDKAFSSAMTQTLSKSPFGPTNLNDFFARSETALGGAADIVTQIATILQSNENCFVGASSVYSGTAVSLVGLATSIVSSGDGVRQKSSQMVASIIKLIQDEKFKSSLGNLEKNDFWNAVSCMLESTAESYCAARDARVMLESQSDSPVQKWKGTEATPLAGYYVLSTHLPNILKWLQNVQIGAPPNRISDANNKANAIKDVSNFWQQAFYKLKAKVNERTSGDFNQLDLDGKRNTIIKLIGDLMTDMNITPPGGGALTGEEQGQNFFAITQNYYKMPFYLLGLDKTPDCVFQQGQVGGCTWDSWLQLNNFSNTKLFADTASINNLVVVIKQQVDKLANDANSKARAYLGQNVITNPVSLVLSALIGQLYTVKESFQYTLTYLQNLSSFLNAYPDEDTPKIQLGIRDTARRIVACLRSFDAQLAPLANFNPQTDADSQKVFDAFNAVVQTVYDQMDMSRQQDTYLTLNLKNFVWAEYKVRVRKGVGMREYEETFLQTVGDNLIDTIVSLHSVSKTSLVADLSQANTTNLDSLGSLEGLYADSIEAYLPELNFTINNTKGADITAEALNESVRKRLANDSRRGSAAVNADSSRLGWFGFLGPAGRYLGLEFLHKDAYPNYSSSQAYIIPTHDIHDVFAYTRNRLCIQTLAFNHNKRYEQYCKNAALISSYSVVDPKTQKRSNEVLNMRYEDILNSRDHEDQICAFRTFWRKNNAYWFTLERQNLGGTSAAIQQ